MYKAEHPALKQFFKKHTNHETFGRNKLTEMAYALFPQTVENIRKAISEDQIYISFDGASNTKHKFTGLMVGSLKNPDIGPYLLEFDKELEGTAESGFRFVQRVLEVLYPEGK